MNDQRYQSNMLLLLLGIFSAALLSACATTSANTGSQKAQDRTPQRHYKKIAFILQYITETNDPKDKDINLMVPETEEVRQPERASSADGRIKGVLMPERTGQSSGNLEIYAFKVVQYKGALAAEKSIISRHATTEPDGAFEISEISPGSYVLALCDAKKSLFDICSIMQDDRKQPNIVTIADKQELDIGEVRLRKR